MELVSEDFVSQLEPVNRAERSSAASDRLREMKVGDILFVSREEWKESGYKSKFPTWLKAKSIPARKGSNLWNAFECRTYTEGWIVRRNELQNNA